MSTYKALYEYKARSEKELSLAKDEIVTVLKEDESGWAEGRSESRNAQGWFPISFVAPCDPPKSAVDQLKVKKDKKSKRMSTRFFGGGGGKKDKGTGPSLAASNTVSRYFYNINLIT